MPNPLRVLVLSGATPVRGVAVYWLASRGTLSADSTRTDGSGIASVSWTLDQGAGQQEVAYALQRFQLIPVFDSVPHFTAYATPGPAISLRFSVDPANVFPNRPIRPAVRVTAFDAFDNPTPFAGAITVALGPHAGTGVLSGTRTARPVDSVASFADLSIDQVGGGYTLTASANGVSSATSAPFDVVTLGSGRIAFVSDRDGVAEIYSMNPDGSGVVRLTASGGMDPAWSPDGKRIAFTSAGQIDLMNSDGSGVTTLTAGSDDFDAAWSRDGVMIAGVRLVPPVPHCHTPVGPCPRIARVFLVHADGSGLVVLTNGAVPSWSPDGRIAFQNGGEIYVMNADGSGLTNVTNDPAYDGTPAWSPNGTMIAFSSNRGGALDLYVMNADGTGVTQLTHDQATEGRPAWSPDGSRIVFASDKDGDYEIYVMNADGSGIVPLTDNTAFDDWPTWAP